MLYRKISSKIEDYLKSDSNKMLVVGGARQVGKSYIIRQVGKTLFANYIEVNMEKDKHGKRLFENARSVDDFMLALSQVAGARMKDKSNGEVDYLVDDADNLTTLPIEVKSGKDYYIHSALDHFLETSNYRIQRALVLNNEREVYSEGKVTYMPIYYSMFLQPSSFDSAKFVEI